MLRQLLSVIAQSLIFILGVYL